MLSPQMSGAVRWVLVAEDDDDIRSIIRTSLEQESDGLNVQVVEARDGAEALMKVTHRQFHCVITDLNMPHSNGEEFLRALRSNPLNANTPALVITGHASEEFVGRYSHLKVIPKPFLPEDLVKAVTRELKLGRIDDRVAIHAMNPLVQTLTQILEGDLQQSARPQAPIIKKAGVVPEGEVHCTLLMTTGHTRVRFTVSFDRGVLDFMRRHPLEGFAKAQWASLGAEGYARAFCQAVCDRIAPRLELMMGGLPRLAGTSIVTSRNETEFGDLQRVGGVSIAVECELGRVIASALTPPRTRRI